MIDLRTPQPARHFSYRHPELVSGCRAVAAQKSRPVLQQGGFLYAAIECFMRRRLPQPKGRPLQQQP